MGYLSFVHCCMIPRGVMPTARNPGLGSVWKCDECGDAFLLTRVEFPPGDEPAALLWERLPTGWAPQPAAQ